MLKSSPAIVIYFPQKLFWLMHNFSIRYFVRYRYVWLNFSMFSTHWGAHSIMTSPTSALPSAAAIPTGAKTFALDVGNEVIAKSILLNKLKIYIRKLGEGEREKDREDRRWGALLPHLSEHRCVSFKNQYLQGHPLAQWPRPALKSNVILYYC